MTSTKRDDDRTARPRPASASSPRCAPPLPRANGTITDAELDRERGALVWNVNFEASGDRETDVDVDPRSGRVLRVTQDD